MHINQMHYELKLQLDKIDSLDVPDLLPAEIDSYIQKAIKQWVKVRAEDDKHGEGFESDQKRIDNLKSLHVKSPELQPGLVPILLSNGKYEIRLSGLLYPYLYLTAAELDITSGTCHKNITHTQHQIDDKTTTYSEPSFQWERVLSSFGRSSLGNNTSSVFFDTASLFSVDKVYINYIKQPDRVFFGGYNHIDGNSLSTDPPIDCDIDESFHDEIVTLAVQLTEKDLRDQLGYSLAHDQVQTDK